MDYLFTKTPLVFFVQNFWRDEAFSFLMAEQSVLDIIKTTAADFNPPLYYILLHYWMMIFGSSEVAIRSISVIFFAGTLFILYEIMRRVFNIPMLRSLLYLGFMMVNPFLLSYAFEARMYMMVTFFVTLSFYALWTQKRWLYVIAMILGIYTHYFSIFILIAQFLYYFFREMPHLIKNAHKLLKSFHVKRLKSIIEPFQAFVIVGLLFLPWALYLLFTHEFGSDGFWIIKPPLNDLKYLPFVLFTGYERVFGEYYHEAAGYTNFHRYFNMILWILLLVPTAALITSFVKKKISNIWLPYLKQFHLAEQFLWTFFAPVTIFFISLVSTPLYHPRYFIFAVPGMILLLISSFEIGMSILSHLTRKNTQKTIVATAAITLLLFYVYSLTQTFNTLNLKYRSKRTVSRMYQEITATMKPQDVILLTRDMDYPLARYYTENQDIKIFNKSYEDIPAYIGKVLIPSTAVVFQYPRYPAKAFVIYYNSYEIHSQQ